MSEEQVKQTENTETVENTESEQKTDNKLSHKISLTTLLSQE